MRNKILVFAVILLSVFCLASCGGEEEYCRAYFYNENGTEIGCIDDLILGKDNKIHRSDIVHSMGGSGNDNIATLKEGYTFCGYANKDGVKYFDGNGNQVADIIIDKTVHLYPVYEPYSYTFSFDAQAGMLDTGANSTIAVKYGDDLTGKFPCATTSNPKFEFDGWFNEDGSIRYSNGTVPVNSKLTYNVYLIGENGTTVANGSTIEMYAKFKVKEFTVTLDFCDGVTPAKEIKVEYGKPIGDLSEYYKDTGTQDIAGWSSLSYSDAPLPDAVTEDIRIYAVWQDYKNVTFVADGVEVVKKIHYAPGTSTELPNDVFYGYTVIGWYSNSAFSGNPISKVPYGALKDKYYAKVERAEGFYTVSFNTGSDDSVNPIVYCHGDTVKLPIPKRENGIFLGWQLEGSEELYFEISANMEGDKTFTAQWMESTPISSAADLEKIRENPSANYHLTNDINFKFENWTPISEFSGTLNGYGYKISNMVLNGNQVEKLAFINNNSGTIKNLSFENASVIIKTNLDGAMGAIIVAKNGSTGKIINCHTLSGSIEYYSEADRTGDSAGYNDIHIGNISAYNLGLISGCSAKADISGTQVYAGVKGHACVGGLVASVNGEGVITDSYAELTIGARGEARKGLVYFRIGGLVGQMWGGTIERSYAKCNVDMNYNITSGTNYGHSGGFIGLLDHGTINECYSEGRLHSSCYGKGSCTGGFAGLIDAQGTVANCYSNVTTLGVGHNMTHNLGSFVGHDYGNITNCYATGTIENWAGETGTFAGHISTSGTVKCCFTTLTGAFNGGGSGSKINNANANDHTLDELKSKTLLCDKLYFDNEIWVIDGKELPTLAWQKTIIQGEKK